MTIFDIRWDDGKWLQAYAVQVVAKDLTTAKKIVSKKFKVPIKKLTRRSFEKMDGKTFNYRELW